MATDFKYAAQTDLEMYYPAYSQFDTKHQVFGWVHTGGDKYVSYNSGIVTQLFRDGQDLGAAQSTHGDVDADYEWAYDSTNDAVYVHDTTGSPADLVMEAGIDNATYFDQMLVNASMELNNLLDRRYPTPVSYTHLTLPTILRV